MPSMLRRISSRSSLKGDDDSVMTSSSRKLRRVLSKNSLNRKSAKENKENKNKPNPSVDVPTKVSVEALAEATKSDQMEKLVDVSTEAKNEVVSLKESTESEVKKVAVVDDDAVTEETENLSKSTSFDSASAGSKGSNEDVDPADVVSVVFLLIDTTTQRFELIQIEIDSSRTTAADVISQIPQSAGDNMKENMTCCGICKVDGTELGPSGPIGDFFSENELFIAIPEGFDGKKTSDKAAPILADSKVIDMLQSSGVSLPVTKETQDTDATEDDSCEPKPDEVPESTETNETKDMNNDVTAAKKDVVKQIEKSPKVYRFALIGFLFVALCLLAYAVVTSSAAPTLSVDPTPEPMGTDLKENITGPVKKKKLFKFRKEKVVA